MIPETINILEKPSTAQKILNFDRHKPENVKHLLFMWLNEENEEGVFLLIMNGKKGGTAIKPVHQSQILGKVVSSSCKIIIIPNLTPDEVFNRILNRHGIKFVKIIDKQNCVIAIAKK